MFPKPIEVKALPDYRIWLRYDDATEGISDLSHLTGKGVFKEWDEKNNFNKVFINKKNSSVAWNDILELCPDALYLKLRGLTFEEWKETMLHHAAD